MTVTTVPPRPVYAYTCNAGLLAYLLYRGAVLHRVHFVPDDRRPNFHYSTPSYDEGVQWRHAYRDPASTVQPYTLLRLRDRITNYVHLARQAPGQVYEHHHEGRDHIAHPRERAGG